MLYNLPENDEFIIYTKDERWRGINTSPPSSLIAYSNALRWSVAVKARTKILQGKKVFLGDDPHQCYKCRTLEIIVMAMCSPLVSRSVQMTR